MKTARRLIARDHCPACGSDSVHEAYRRAYASDEVRGYLESFYRLSSQGVDYQETFGAADYVLDRCGDCAALFQRNIATEDLASELYGQWIENSDTPSPEPLGHFTHHVQEAMQAVAFAARRRSLASPLDVRVFDFGLGWSAWAKAAVGLGCQVYGFDLSEQRRTYAAAHSVRVLSWDEMPGQEIDFINTEQVFEHLPDPLGTARHLASALRPGGVLKISVPTARWLDKGAVSIDWKAPRSETHNVNPVTPLEHITYFPKSALRTMAAKAGLIEVHVPVSLQYAYTTDFSTPRRIAKNLARPFWARRQNLLYFARPA